MFSAVSEGGPATATRSRRRQRPLSSDSLVQQPKAKRQRLPLTEQTFLHPENNNNTIAPDAPPEMYEVKADDRVASLPAKQDGIENFAVGPVPKKDVQTRVKKPKAADRMGKGDGGIVLSHNNAFTVSKLPALPDRMRADSAAPQHGDVYASTGYALSLTHTHAIVWPYTSTTPSPETFTFTLPYPSKQNTEPLPLGTLVAPSAASSEPGLVVVMPVSGRITYWESISSAATLDFIRQQRNGVEGTVSGMFSGERVVQIANAESAGFVLAFSSGRLAYMNVRDSHGRPSVSTQFLRTSLGPTSNGIFGSIRHVLTSATSRGEIAAVRVEGSARVGERSVIAATLRGKLHAWRIHRGGHHDTVAEADLKDDIVAAIQGVDRAATAFAPDSFELLDFSFVPKGLEQRYKDMSKLSDAMVPDDHSVHQLVALVSLSTKKMAHYSLVEIILGRDEARVGMVRPISSYSTRVSSSNPSSVVRPRLYLPRPGMVAFLVFDRTVVVASIAIPPESPDSQLQEDNRILPPVYEDVVDLRDDGHLEIVGSGFEEPAAALVPDSHRSKTKNPAAILIVKGAGVLRITTTDVDKFASDRPPTVTAKSKLEQAVFFGVKTDNPLVFDGRRESHFTHEEISDAALQLSQEILSSTSPHMATLPASLEDNLSSRVRALERLIHHLKSTKVALTRRTRWTLLWNAEKMMVATLLWRRHEAFTAERPVGDKKSIVADIVEFIHEDQKKEVNRAVGEVDRVRHWFINDVFRVEIFVAWAYEVIKYIYKDKLMDDVRITRLMYEAVQVNICALVAGWDYRHAQLATYGLDKEDMEPEMRILRSGYEGLREPWTGSYFISNNLKRLVELGNEWLGTYYPPAGAPGQPDPNLIERIAIDMPSLTDIYLVSLLEQARWAAHAEDPKSVNTAQKFAKTYEIDREEKSLWLAKRGQWDEGARITEKHHCWHGLAVVMIDHVHALEQAAAAPETTPLEGQRIIAQSKFKYGEMEAYLNKYGEVFAFELYERMLEVNGFQAVLDFALDKNGYKTKFLRTKPELARISWINDIEKEKDIDHAAETLLDLGLTREQQVWNKKIELSLGKLALLAEAEPDPEPSIFAMAKMSNGTRSEPKHEAQLEQIDRELGLIRIQDQLYSQVFRSIKNAIDETAELEIAMEHHSGHIPKRQKVLLQMFENGMRRLLSHEALDVLSLIDLLTLISLRPESREEMEDSFYLALQAAEYGLKGEELKNTKRLIWRRLFLRDDWTKINDTQLKDDNELAETLYDTALFYTLSTCYAKSRPVDGPFQPMVPSEALGVYTDSADRRFNDMEKSFRDKLMDAMKWEDAQLRKHIDKHRLEQWLRTTAETAEATLREMVDEATKEGAKANGSADGDVVMNGNGKSR